MRSSRVSTWLTDEATGAAATVSGLVDVVVGETVELVLDARTILVAGCQGTVRSGGAPQAQYTVVLSTTEGTRLGSQATDREGRFSFKVARAGPVVLTVRARSGSTVSAVTRTVVLQEGSVVTEDIDLPAAGVVGGDRQRQLG